VDPPATTVRTIHRIDVEEQGRLLVFDVWGRSFLYKMVRTLVGTLLEVGRGRWAPSRIEACLASRDRRSAGPTLPPRGLCLEAVLYDPGSLDGVRGRDDAIREDLQKSFPWATL
jgi:tRNA pseudouridine38-40 synthase